MEQLKLSSLTQSSIAILSLQDDINSIRRDLNFSLSDAPRQPASTPQPFKEEVENIYVVGSPDDN